MKLRKYLGLVGALGIIFSFTSQAQAGLFDWIENFNREKEREKDVARQLRFYSVENCKKYFEKGDLEQARYFCPTAATQNRDLIYYAAVVEYLYNTEPEIAIITLKKAEKYFLERLEANKENEQARIEDEKKLAYVYLWLGDEFRWLEKKKGDRAIEMKEKWGEFPSILAKDYYKKALALAEKLGDKGDSYVIARAGGMLGELYSDWVMFNPGLIKKTEEVLEKALKAIDEVKPSLLVSKGDILRTKITIYDAISHLYLSKLKFKEIDEKEFEKAKEYLLKAIDIAKVHDQENLPTLKHNLAVCHWAIKEYDMYEKYTKEAIELEKKKGRKADKLLLADWYIELADFYLEKKNDKKSAKESLIQAVELYETLRDEFKNDKIKWIKYDREAKRVLKRINEIGATQ
jgi:tetratricopeptide (TPR) repeat protein